MSDYDELAELLEKLQDYCHKHELPMVTAVQVGTREDEGGTVYNLRGGWNGQIAIEDICPGIVEATFDLFIDDDDEAVCNDCLDKDLN